jgi:hypothetical protein
MMLRAYVPILTDLYLVGFGVIFLLLPAVTAQTLVFTATSFFVIRYERISAPVLALVLGVLVYLGLPSIVLPIVCVYAELPLMLCFVKGAPNRFKMEHIEIRIHLKPVNLLHGYFRGRVGKRAVIPVLAFPCFVNV